MALRLINCPLTSKWEAQVGLRKAFNELPDVETREFLWRARFDAVGLGAMTTELADLCREFKPDVIHLQQAKRFTPATIKRVRDTHDCLITHWNADIRAKPEDYIVELGRRVDLTLISNRGELEWYRRLGLRRVEYLQMAFDGDIFRPVPPSPDQTHEVVYFGHNYYNPSRNAETNNWPGVRLRLEMLEKVATVADVTTFGSKWPGKMKLAGIALHGKMAKICSSSKIALGASAFNNVHSYTSDRLFRMMGCGICYVCAYFPGIEDMFVNWRHLVWFKSVGECLEIVRDLLRDDVARRRIANEGARIMHRKHTWAVRAREYLAMVRELV